MGAAGGAFTVLAVFLGGGGIGLGVFAVRQIGRSGRLVSGRGMAVTGIILGSVGSGIGVLSLLLALLLVTAA